MPRHAFAIGDAHHEHAFAGKLKEIGIHREKDAGWRMQDAGI
jgi:hypothetical protein